MQLLPTLSMTPEAWQRWGSGLLIACLSAGLLLVLYVAAAAPELSPWLPLLLVAGISGAFLFNRPFLNLIVVLCGFIALTDYEAGLQPAEIIYGLYYMSFLAHWFATRFLIYRAPVLTSSVDKAVLGLLLVVTCWIPVAVLFDAPLSGIFSEWQAFTMLAFYFPVKEAVIRNRQGARILLWVLGFIGFYVAVRNALNYQAVLMNATQAWQVAKGRVATNDNLLMVVSLFGLVLFVFARNWKQHLLLLGLFLLYFSGLILTQSRAYWLAFLFGAFIMFALVSPKRKRRIVLFGATAFAGFLGLSLFLMGDFVLLVLTGLTDRLFTLQTAITKDISLVNRWRETAAVWEHVVANPILGYGMAVSYEFYDIAHGFTDTDAFVHNGYLSLWYKYGLLGLGITLFFWFKTLARAVRTFRLPQADPTLRLAGLVTATTLSAFLLSTITSNPFFLNDTLFILAFLLGMANGVYERAQRGT